MSKLSNGLRLAGMRRVLRRINSLAPAMERKSDPELRAMTRQLKRRLQKGASEEAILPEAYAAIREACRRVLGIYPYDTQMLGAIALHQGAIAEMGTGEGKTFTAVMPLYLCALTGKSAILVTMNEYLANRDANLLAPLYEWMGVSIASAVPENPKYRISIEEKKEIYQADVVYTTGGGLAFDYLLENLQTTGGNRFLPPFHFVVIDEADSILLDMAQIPLVISGASKEQSNLFEMADYFVSTLTRGNDYIVDDDAVWLTGRGIEKAERFFRIGQLYSAQNHSLVRHINLALRAHYLFIRDRQYVMEGDQIALLDANTGRVVENTKLQAGQHQALEAKEHLPITPQTRARGSITFQDFYNMFPKVAGMTGTAMSDAREIREIYGLEVVAIPPNEPLIRRDYKDVVFGNIESMMEAVIGEATELHAEGRPVLIVTSSVPMSQLCSSYLMKEGVPHNVLNAYNVAMEAQIIAEAGQRGAMTVATVMAGRGTDIRLGQGVAKKGGLCVLGVGRMENRRLEGQARGRAGRQGDPGETRFFVSLEDDVVARYGKSWLERYRKEGVIGSGRVIREVKRCQRVSEEQARSARGYTLMFGESVRLQREMIYQMRNEILEHPVTDPRYYLSVERALILDFLDEGQNVKTVIRYCLDNINYNPETLPRETDLRTELDVIKYLMRETNLELKKKLALLDTDERRVRFFQSMTLKAIDEAWMEQVDYLQQLRKTMAGRRYTLRNVAYEYHLESFEASKRMQKKIRSNMMRNILLGEIVFSREEGMQVVLP